MSPAEASISVVIRVRNEGSALAKVLRALQSQDITPLEVVVVDNDSSDDSRVVAECHGAKILHISRADFTYGRALNLGIRNTSGQFISILSAHSLPIGCGFLRSAVAPFCDEQVGAVRCLSVTSRHELEHWIQPKALEWPAAIETVISSAPVNCAAMIRRLVWEGIPYDETLPSVEDKFWALQVLKSGYRICGSSAVYLYLRDFGLHDKVRALLRDRMVYFQQTGREWQEPPVRLRTLLSNTLCRIPRRALREALYETALYFCLKTIPYRSSRPQHKTHEPNVRSERPANS